eukprot:gene26514-33102_t
MGRVFAAQAERALASGFDVLQQVGHGRGVELQPGLLPSLRVAITWCARKGLRSHRATDGQRARAVQPKGVDGVLPAGLAGVVHRVVVQQHLHLALQALQGPGSGVVGHPVFDVLADHPVERGGGHIGQQGPLCVPQQGAVPRHLQAVFLQKRLHGQQQLLRFIVRQVQMFWVGHDHLVHADLPVAGRHPGLGLGTGLALPRQVPGGPWQGGRVDGPAQGLGLQAFVGQVQRCGFRALQHLLALKQGQQGLQIRQLQTGPNLGAVEGVAGCVGNDQVHGARLSQAPKNL